jgi:uncharacterized protein (DUF1697 family)
MTSYLALLRGVNVGGKAMIKMSDLQTCLSASGLSDVRTYIQSGNVLFLSESTDDIELASIIHKAIAKAFQLQVAVVVYSKADWQHVITAAPNWWGQDQQWKHNLLVLLKPYHMPSAVAAIGTLKPDIEALEPGMGVLYQSMSKVLFGRTTTGKLASSPIYKQMTVRNYNTATKLLTML